MRIHPTIAVILFASDNGLHMLSTCTRSYPERNNKEILSKFNQLSNIRLFVYAYVLFTISFILTGELLCSLLDSRWVRSSNESDDKHNTIVAMYIITTMIHRNEIVSLAFKTFQRQMSMLQSGKRQENNRELIMILQELSYDISDTITYRNSR